MKTAHWFLVAALLTLSACGAGEAPRVEGGMDLTELWRRGS